MSNTYFRTGHGTHRHASVDCANVRRMIHTGDPVELTAAEINSYPACEFCCSADEITASAKTIAAQPVKTLCKNDGVTNMRRLRSTCSNCGKEGAVNRKTGSLKAHEAI